MSNELKVGQRIKFNGYIFPIIGVGEVGITFLTEGNEEFLKVNTREIAQLAPMTQKYWGYSDRYFGKHIYRIPKDTAFLLLVGPKERCKICSKK